MSIKSPTPLFCNLLVTVILEMARNRVIPSARSQMTFVSGPLECIYWVSVQLANYLKLKIKIPMAAVFTRSLKDKIMEASEIHVYIKLIDSL